MGWVRRVRGVTCKMHDWKNKKADEEEAGGEERKMKERTSRQSVRVGGGDIHRPRRPLQRIEAANRPLVDVVDFNLPVPRQQHQVPENVGARAIGRVALLPVRDKRFARWQVRNRQDRLSVGRPPVNATQRVVGEGHPWLPRAINVQDGRGRIVLQVVENVVRLHEEVLCDAHDVERVVVGEVRRFQPRVFVAPDN